MNNILKRAIAVIVGMCLIITALFIAVAAYAFNLQFFASEFEKNDTYQCVNIEKSELDMVAAQLIGYIGGWESELNISAVVNGEERMFFSEREIEHMADVKAIFDVFKIIALIAACILIVCIICYKRKGNVRMLAKYMLITILSVTSAMLLFVILCIIDFNSMFTLFHKVFFTNDLWLLDPATELLINIVPLPFFIDIAAGIGIVFGIMMAVSSVVLWHLLKKSKRRTV